jgi:hypothetical protein
LADDLDDPLAELADDPCTDDEIGRADDEIGVTDDGCTDDEIGRADDKIGVVDDCFTLINPELVVGCEPDEPRDDTDSDDNDETGFADDTGTTDGAYTSPADDAEERDDTLPGYPVSMFGLRFNRIFSSNWCFSRHHERTTISRPQARYQTSAYTSVPLLTAQQHLITTGNNLPAVFNEPGYGKAALALERPRTPVRVIEYNNRVGSQVRQGELDLIQRTFLIPRRAGISRVEIEEVDRRTGVSLQPQVTFRLVYLHRTPKGGRPRPGKRHVRRIIVHRMQPAPVVPEKIAEQIREIPRRPIFFRPNAAGFDNQWALFPPHHREQNIERLVAIRERRHRRITLPAFLDKMAEQRVGHGGVDILPLAEEPRGLLGDKVAMRKMVRILDDIECDSPVPGQLVVRLWRHVHRVRPRESEF